MNSKTGKIDYQLALTVLILTLFGIVMVASIGVPKSIELTKSVGVSYPTCGLEGVDCYLLLKRHISRVFLALGIGIFALKIPTHWFKKYAILLMGATILLLVTVLVIGSSFTTFAKGWLIVKGTSVQPLELAKIGFIVYLARWLTNKGDDIKDLNKGVIPFIVICGIVIGLLVAQPDFGGALIFSFIGVGMFYLAGARLKHLLTGAAIVTVIVSIVLSVGHDYLRHRFLSYLDPTEENCIVNDSGSVKDYCWQTQQANIAVASGGFWGKGLTKGVQKSYWLPQASDDFIFAASAEELGFLRSILIIFAFLFIGYKGLAIARTNPDKYSSYLATGITLWLTGQAFLNIGVNTGVLPVTGVTLPFISYGGTSMLANMFAIGMLLNISKSSKLTYDNKNSSNRRRNSGTHNTQSRTYRIIDSDFTEPAGSAKSSSD